MMVPAGREGAIGQYDSESGMSTGPGLATSFTGELGGLGRVMT